MKEPYPVGTKVIAVSMARYSIPQILEITKVRHPRKRCYNKYDDGSTDWHTWWDEEITEKYEYLLTGMRKYREADKFIVLTLHCESCGEERSQHECIVYCGPCGGKINE